VLELLRHAAGRPCSGEALSAELGVSRNQVWKHVEALRGHGYGIDGEPGGGYRLVSAPDRLFAEEILPRLATRWLARELQWLDVTDSTNRVAAEWARAGAPHGATVVAESQTAGRGRLGRSFFSPAYQNLYTSSVLRPLLPVTAAPTVILAAAIAVAETVAESVPDPAAVEIKWPNDVLLGGLKTSGILMEMHAEAARVDFLVLGIGVNLNVERDRFPEAFRASATSLGAFLGRPVPRADFAARLYGTLERVLDLHAQGGFASLRDRFEARFRMRGRRVRVLEIDGASQEGRVLGIDDGGALLLADDSGATLRVVAGDVTLAKQDVR
jgi:BirA family biotin operon repressor/biotin-[acetyl-CoA-carboxylase] ligase